MKKFLVGLAISGLAFIAVVAGTLPTMAQSSTPTVAPTNDLVNPVLAYASDCAPEISAGCSLDVGVNAPYQIAVIFGRQITWPEGGFQAGTIQGCQMVAITTGWYENLKIVDGRVEVYNIPSSDPEGWFKVLVDQRTAEQSKHYKCPVSEEHVAYWTTDSLPVSWPDHVAGKLGATYTPTPSATPTLTATLPFTLTPSITPTMTPTPQ